MLVMSAMAAASIFSVPIPPPEDTTPRPRMIANIERGAPPRNRHLTDPLRSGFQYVLRLDEGRINVFIDHAEADAHIDAHWPHNGGAMMLALNRVASWGYQPIPEEDSPAELLDNGMVRIYLEEM